MPLSHENLRYTLSEMTVGNFSFPTGDEIGEVAPGCWLIEEDGNYAIIVVSGETGHEVLWFPDTPTPDPDPECILEDQIEKSFDWLEKVLEWAEEATMSAEDGYFLCHAAKMSGWREGNVLLWFYHKAGELLERKT